MFKVVPKLNFLRMVVTNYHFTADHTGIADAETAARKALLLLPDCIANFEDWLSEVERDPVVALPEDAKSDIRDIVHWLGAYLEAVETPKKDFSPNQFLEEMGGLLPTVVKGGKLVFYNATIFGAGATACYFLSGVFKSITGISHTEQLLPSAVAAAGIIHMTLKAARDSIRAEVGSEAWIADMKRKLSAVPVFTPREREVAIWVMVGKNSTEIAMILGISPHTAKNYITRMREKLKASNTAQLVSVIRDLTSTK